MITREAGMFVMSEAVEYWRGVVLKAPWLAKLALRLLSLTPTQATAERSFPQGFAYLMAGRIVLAQEFDFVQASTYFYFSCFDLRRFEME